MKIYNPDYNATGLPEIGEVGGSPFKIGRSPFEKAEPITGKAEASFEDALKDTIARVNETQNSADESVARLAAGQEPNIHNTMLELSQAEISLKLAMKVRSKALEAYQELMRMQV